MRQLLATDEALAQLAAQGWNWPQVRDDLVAYEVMTPDRNGGSNYFAHGDLYTGRVMHDLRDPTSGTWWLYKTWLRERADFPSPNPVVGIEHRRGMRRGHGGAGRQWPTTTAELIQIIEAQRGLRVMVGPTHLLVLREGKVVSTMPKTASDYRSLVNCCQELKRIGIDVRRPQMNQRKAQ